MKLDWKKWTTDERLLKRLIITVGVLVVLVIVAFGGYYYYDRYYSAKPKVMDTNIQKAEQAVNLDPKNLDKRLDLANLYLINNRFTDAISSAAQVLQQDPENQKGWLILGLGYALKSQPDAAIEPLQKYYDANKNSNMPGLNKTLQTAAYYLGVSYYKMGQADKAAEPLENAVRWAKTDADAMYQLGLVYTVQKKYNDALAMFTYATALVPDYREAYEGMAAVFTQTNQTDLVNYAQGMVSYSNKDYATAIDLLLKSTQAKADFSPAFSGLGLSYEAQGDLEKAKLAFETALKLESTNLTAQQGDQRVTNLLNKK